MHLPSVSGRLFSEFRPARSLSAFAALVMVGAALATVAPHARADDGRVVVSTGLGAVAGALIGQSIGGRNATIVGGAIGAAIGASAATQGGYRHGNPSVGYATEYNQGGYNQGGYYQGAYAAPVVYAPPLQVYRPVMRPAVYPVVYYGGYQGNGGRYENDHYRHDGRGWDNGRRDNRRGGRNDRDDRGDRGGWDHDRGNFGHHR